MEVLTVSAKEADVRRLAFESQMPMPLDVRVERYLNRHGLTCGGPSGSYDAELEDVLAEAKTMLPWKDKLFLFNCPVYTMPGILEGGTSSSGDPMLINALTNERGIAIYPECMRRCRPKDFPREKFLSWMVNLLKHEIGHARDHYSDHFMAKEFNY